MPDPAIRSGLANGLIGRRLQRQRETAAKRALRPSLKVKGGDHHAGGGP